MKKAKCSSCIKILYFVFFITCIMFSVTYANPYAQISSFGPSQSSGEYRVETYANGDRYEGYFVNGLYHGKGTYIWANGDRYEGEFMNGQIDGAGRLTFFGNGQYWEGLFVQGKISNGSGIFYWGDNGDKFDGQWLNGKPEGTGILLHADGTSNKVTFSNGQLISQEGSTAGGNQWTDVIQRQPYTGSASSPFQNIKVGDVVSFGRYEQDNNYNNGSEPIQWKCIDIDYNTGRALMLSVYGLETMAYHWNSQSITWEGCSLRDYLNSNFYKGVFNDTERQWIAQTLNSNPGSSAFGTYGGNNTYDYVFLLSIDQIMRYFPYEALRKAQPTALARAHGAYGTADPSCAWWWLRTPGQYSSAATSINSLGVLLNTGPDVSDITGMIRPAIWVKLAG